MSAQLLPPDINGLARAAEALRNGRLVAFPTETVYGLGADATNESAVARIYTAKQRPAINPLIIHVADIAQLEGQIVFNKLAEKLAHRFWPGGITLVLPITEHCSICPTARAHLQTIAVRIPSHPIARALLEEAKIPVAAPSANPSGLLSATTPQHVVRGLGDVVDIVLIGGRTHVGVESTIIDCTTETPRLLRTGAIAQELIEQECGSSLEARLHSGAPQAPGQLTRHYAPRKPLRLNVTTATDEEYYITFGAELGLIGGKVRKNLSINGDLDEAAANLFMALHEADMTDCAGIAVSPIPRNLIGAAINDRLLRGTAPD